MILKVAGVAKEKRFDFGRIILGSLAKAVGEAVTRLDNFIPAAGVLRLFHKVLSDEEQKEELNGAVKVEDTVLPVERYQDLIRELYTEHNPSKLESLDNLFAKWAGKEKDLYTTICQKYGVEPQVSAVKAEEEKEDDQTAAIKDLIVTIYQEHKPERVNDVDKLLAKSKGREAELYKSLCQKYKVPNKLEEEKVKKEEDPAAEQKEKPLSKVQKIRKIVEKPLSKV